MNIGEGYGMTAIVDTLSNPAKRQRYVVQTDIDEVHLEPDGGRLAHQDSRSPAGQSSLDGEAEIGMKHASAFGACQATRLQCDGGE